MNLRHECVYVLVSFCLSVYACEHTYVYLNVEA